MTHPDADLFWSYLEEVVPAHTGPLWSLLELETDISKGAHTSACILEITNFVWGEIQMRIKDGFSILFLMEDAIILFGGKLKIS